MWNFGLIIYVLIDSRYDKIALKYKKNPTKKLLDWFEDDKM